ncbi:MULTISPECIES: hypothetical protein [Paenibacillus]|uniref:hypothetical protein n=1 Tax=Paenibacillus TaxID=44249 RepID=UPI00037A91E1|nr:MULTISPECIES: hypothetical protein [Paenibacillus]KAF6585701.1 hypothetical protein G9G57_03085 [Paenibacillus sp. EKM211P]KKD52745.1 hypothetical protein C400_20165 [Paenibacillus sp. ICGEB2008]MDU8671993.1 hypothetical protein [Paenibacillus polymyxa]MDU8696902.1 hypothetical protein [Paenibacillus polymyxa]MEE4576975.1 hypothetical protein [Paenibacillus polymyxa]
MKDQESAVATKATEEVDNDPSFWDMFPVDKQAARIISGLIIGGIILWFLYGLLRYGLVFNITIN